MEPDTSSRQESLYQPLRSDSSTRLFILNAGSYQDQVTGSLVETDYESGTTDSDSGTTDSDSGTTDSDSGTTGSRSSTTDSDPGTADYEAVSYAWGSSDGTHDIWIDGHKVVIRENLFNALRRLRRSDDPARSGLMRYQSLKQT